MSINDQRPPFTVGFGSEEEASNFVSRCRESWGDCIESVIATVESSDHRALRINIPPKRTTTINQTTIGVVLHTLRCFIRTDLRTERNCLPLAKAKPNAIARATAVMLTPATSYFPGSMNKPLKLTQRQNTLSMKKSEPRPVRFQCRSRTGVNPTLRPI